MKKIPLSSLKKFSPHTIQVLMLICILILAAACQEKETYRIVRFNKDINITNFSRNFFQIVYNSDSIPGGAMIVKKGDLLATEEFLYTLPDWVKDSMSLKYDDDELYIDGKLVSLLIDSKDPEIQIKKVLETDISGLSFLYFASSVSDSCITALQQLSARKKDISIGFEDTPNKLDSILQYFKPRILLIPKVSDQILTEIKDNCSPEILFTGIADTLIKSPMPPIPSLKQIIFSGSSEKITENFFALNPQIESLSFPEAREFNLALIQSLRNLKSLVFMNADTVIAPEKIKNNPRLEILTVSSQLMRNNPALDELRNLKWVQFYSDIDQQQFDSFIGKHPGIEVVEIYDCSKLKITQSLASLKNLQGLVLTNHSLDSSSVKNLTNLKYLALPNADLKDPKAYILLKQAMPNTVIAACDGVCMGSGWILLLMPFVIAFRYLTQLVRYLQRNRNE
jgi:hypothetical protein